MTGDDSWFQRSLDDPLLLLLQKSSLTAWVSRSLRFALVRDVVAVGVTVAALKVDVWGISRMSHLGVVVSVEDTSDWKALTHLRLLIEHIVHRLSIRKVLVGDLWGHSWNSRRLGLLFVVPLVVTRLRVLGKLRNWTGSLFTAALEIALTSKTALLVQTSSFLLLK